MASTCVVPGWFIHAPTHTYALTYKVAAVQACVQAQQWGSNDQEACVRRRRKRGKHACGEDSCAHIRLPVY